MYKEKKSVDKSFIKKNQSLEYHPTRTCVIANKTQTPKFKTIFFFKISYL